MAKDVKFFYESEVALGVSADEAEMCGTIEAVLTTWGAREGADGRRFNYQPEAFKEWAAGYAEMGKPLPMYFQHNDESLPVGEWTMFEFDDVGMTGKGRLFTNTTIGKDLYTIMKESPNMVGGVSVGAYADEYQMVNANNEVMNPLDPAYDEGYFQITKGGLREVSIVMNPNNPEANINKLENVYRADGTINLKEVESVLRDAGLTKMHATAASSIFNKVIKLRDAGNETVETPPNLSESDAAVNQAILAELNKRELLKQLNKRIKG
jgi:HK97 family phage prohead protease